MNYTDRIGGIPAREDLLAEILSELRSTFDEYEIWRAAEGGPRRELFLVNICGMVRNILDEERS